MCLFLVRIGTFLNKVAELQGWEKLARLMLNSLVVKKMHFLVTLKAPRSHIRAFCEVRSKENALFSNTESPQNEDIFS